MIRKCFFGRRSYDLAGERDLAIRVGELVNLYRIDAFQVIWAGVNYCLKHFYGGEVFRESVIVQKLR